MCTLAYVDDLITVESGDALGVQRSTVRVTVIAKDSRDDDDMTVNVSNADALIVQVQDTVPATTVEEVKTVCQFE